MYAGRDSGKMDRLREIWPCIYRYCKIFGFQFMMKYHALLGYVVRVADVIM